MLRFAISMTLAACFAAAQTEAPASEWKHVAKEITGEAAMIRVAARDLAVKDTGLAVDLGALRDEVDGEQVRAARIQTKLYEVERSECAAGLYEDGKLDRLKEEADRLSDLTAIQRATLHVPTGKPDWKILKRQAKSTRLLAHKIQKDIEEFAD